MKYASIDIGTNTVRLLIAEMEKDDRGQKRLNHLSRKMEITRLGESLYENKKIGKIPLDKTIEVVKKYKNIIEKNNVTGIVVAATSAVRDAHNKELFLDEVEKKTGFKVKVLSGEKEADLALSGAICGTKDLLLGKGEVLNPQLIIDIGGGSTEILMTRLINISIEKIFRNSMDMGSVRLTELFIKSDPPQKDEIEKCILSIRENLHCLDHLKKIFKPKIAIGLAGTITTLSAIKQKLAIYDEKKTHLSQLSLDDIEKILVKFMIPLEKRKTIAGLHPKRADVIIAGTLIIREILKFFNLSQLIVSEYDILDGLILEETLNVQY